MGPPLIYVIYRIYREIQKNGGSVNDTNLRELIGKNGGSGEEVKLLDQIEELKKREEYIRTTLIESQTKWTGFSKGILSVCKSLLEVSKSNKGNEALRQKIFDAATSKVEKYEKILATNEQDLQEIEHKYKESLNSPQIKQVISPKQASVLPNIGEIDEQASISSINYKASQDLSMTDQVLPDLSYDKLKDVLQNSKEPLRICALLQALRWRITRTKHGMPRKAIIQSFVDNDLLSCSAQNSQLLSILIMNANKK